MAGGWMLAGAQTPDYLGAKSPPEHDGGRTPSVGSKLSDEATRGERSGSMTVSDRSGPPTAAEARAWFNQQIPYRNMADDPEIAARVVTFVRECRQIYEEKTSAVRARWRVNNHLLGGNSVSRIPGLADVHVPEVYKKVKQMVPRIAEAAHPPGVPKMHVMGVDEDSKVDAELTQAFLESQLRDTKYDRLVEPILWDAIVHQIGAVKLSWEQRIGRRPQKEVKEVKVDGGVDYQIFRWFDDQLVYDGPRIDRIAPQDFVADTSRVDEDEMLFIGHRSRLTRGQIKRSGEGENPPYLNTDEVDQMQPYQEGTSAMDSDKLWASITERFDPLRRAPDGGPQEFVVDEMAAFFDLYGDGQEIDCILTTVNEKLCVRAIENFYDFKQRPYALCRFATGSNELFGTGEIDLAVRINEEFDTHRQLFMQSHKLHVSPIIATEGDSDFPDYMHEIIPGQIFNAVGKLSIINVPNTLEAVPFVEETLRRDIEETTGSPNLWEGSSGGEGQTATLSIQKQQEGNRRNGGRVTNYTHFARRIGLLLHRFNRQFVTRKKKFRVLGKAAASLGDYAEISPTLLDGDIDIFFPGLEALHTNGLRATAIINLFTVGAQIMQTHGDQIDVLALFEELIRLTIGPVFGRRIVKLSEPLDTMMSAEEEGMLLLSRGLKVKVHPNDDDEEHLRIHIADAKKAMDDGATESELQVWEEHVRDHVFSAKSKQAQQQAANGRQPAFAQLPQPPEEGGLNMGAGGLAPGMPPPTGSSAGSVAQTPPGQNPGPADAGKSSKPGRSPATNQTDDKVGGA